jgi:starch phosphorylase
MAQLAPEFSSNRMVREYVEKIYLPAAYTFQHRSAQNCKLAKELHSWATELKKYWHDVHFANIEILQKENKWSFSVQVYLGELEPDMVQIELYAEPQDGEEPGLFRFKCILENWNRIWLRLNSMRTLKMGRNLSVNR